MNENRPIHELTYRRMRLTTDSGVITDEQFQNAKETSGVKANVMCSDLDEKYDSNHHFLTLDIDYPIEFLKSSSGNTHLVFAKAIPAEAMNKVLVAMGDAGLIQKAWVDTAIRNGYTTLRAPGIEKSSFEDNRGLDEENNIESGDDYNRAMHQLRIRQMEKQSNIEGW